MQGGEEKPCMRPTVLAKYEEQTGYPCPYRELDPDNALAMEITSLAWGENTRCFIESTLRLSGESEAAQGWAMERAAFALRHPKVLKRLYPKPEPAEASKG